ncbi:FAD-binding oxidoreductase [Nocardia arizonensis]|uniref:FAD-binding oxidoreductase n=1 Tax=Nocardia arizonensis TaxID=1141647 RepID=UPI0006D0A890|nr:FAD-binding oxidoreductase [Nocardia arizonensis]
MSLPSDEKFALEGHHADIVRATLPLVSGSIDEITTVFYRTLFDHHPALIRDLFNRGNQADGAQQRALATAIARFAVHLVDPTAPSPAAALSRIGHKHASLGITAGQYRIVHDELFAAIVAVLGADVVTTPVAEAWDRVYWIMADALIALERRLYERAGVEPGEVFREAVVVSRVEDVPDVAVFTVEAADSIGPLPHFAAGQYISVAVELADGARQRKQYSLIGPSDGRRLSFAVKRIRAEGGRPAGEVSNRLHDTVAEGDRLRISLPFGDVTVDPAATTPLVLISAGIGVAPMIGILEHVLEHAPNRRVLVVHADRSPSTHPLRTRLLELTARLRASTVELWYAESADGAGHGRFAPEDLTLPDDADIYVCGPTDFLRTVRKGLSDRGISDHRVHVEQFVPADGRALSV